VLALVLAAGPTSSAQAATQAPTQLLAEGIGMGPNPSVRVRVMQRALNKRGYDLGAPGVDGRFGPLTAAAVRRFQSRTGLVVDGLVGRRTRRALGLRQSASATRRPSRTKPTPQAPAQNAPKSAPQTPAQNAPKSAPQTPAQNAPKSAPQTPAQNAPETAPQAPARSVPQTVPLDPAKPAGSALRPVLIGVAAVLLVIALWPLGLTLAKARRAHITRQRYLADYRAKTDVASRTDAADRTTPRDDDGGEDNGGETSEEPSPTAVPPEREAEFPSLSLLTDSQRSPLTEPGHDDRAGWPLPPGARVIGYVSVPGTGSGVMRSQAVEETCRLAQWELVDLVRARENGRGPRQRQLMAALDRVAQGEAAGLVVSDLDRLRGVFGDLAAVRVRQGDHEAGVIVHAGVGEVVISGRPVSVAVLTLGHPQPVQRRGRA
jgi:peptidoglycan hydrolase-like protein with peptidoglycan-binding domain